MERHFVGTWCTPVGSAMLEVSAVKVLNILQSSWLSHVGEKTHLFFLDEKETKIILESGCFVVATMYRMFNFSFGGRLTW